VDVNSPSLNQPTPYLISLLPPSDVILGLIPFAADLWSIAVTVAELFLGEVVFRGKSNNDAVRVHAASWCLLQPCHTTAFSCSANYLCHDIFSRKVLYVFMRVTNDQ
jgi:hypothetical protein